MIETPSFTKQTWWKAGFFKFGNLTNGAVRYFNPTIVTRPDGDWLIARRSEPVPPGSRRHRLDLGMNSLEAFRIYPGYELGDRHQVQFPKRYKDEHFEDPRASVINGSVHMSCTSFQLDPAPAWFGSHQLLAQVDDQWRVVRRDDPAYGLNGASLYVQRGSEKNWLWFEHGGRHHMVYTTVPHQVAVFFRQSVDTYASLARDVPWQHGTLRGGTPPVRVGDEYWTFFHSSLPWVGKKRRYYMGAYAFRAEPPFPITRITPQPLLSGSQSDPWASGLPLVVFPGGALFRDGKWIIVLGINDFCCGWIEIPHAELEPLMEPVASEPVNTYQDVAGNPMQKDGRAIEQPAEVSA